MSGFVRLGISLLAPVWAACYRYTPVQSREVPVGVAVRAHLSESGRARLSYLPRRGDRQVEGEVIGREGDALVLEVRVPADPDLPVTRTLVQRVTLEPGDVVAVELKEPDQPRTAALVAGIGVGVGVVAIKILSGRTENTGEPGEEPPEIRIPLVVRRR